jgi:hypothetical protein
VPPNRSTVRNHSALESDSRVIPFWNHTRFSGATVS